MLVLSGLVARAGLVLFALDFVLFCCGPCWSCRSCSCWVFWSCRSVPAGFVGLAGLVLAGFVGLAGLVRVGLTDLVLAGLDAILSSCCAGGKWLDSKFEVCV